MLALSLLFFVLRFAFSESTHKTKRKKKLGSLGTRLCTYTDRCGRSLVVFFRNYSSPHSSFLPFLWPLPYSSSRSPTLPLSSFTSPFPSPLSPSLHLAFSFPLLPPFPFSSVWTYSEWSEMEDTLGTPLQVAGGCMDRSAVWKYLVARQQVSSCLLSSFV